MALANPLVAPLTDNEVSYASGCLISPVPQVARPRSTSGASAASSNRSRRSNGSSDDQSPVAASDGFVEADLRAGGPILCDGPCNSLRFFGKDRYALNQIGGHDGILELFTICRSAGLEALEIDFVGRRSVFSPDEDPILTLLVVARRDRISATHSWISIARLLHENLMAKGVTGASVEIKDPSFQKKLHLSPCPPTETIFPLWERVAKEIIRSIPLNGIFTINCLRISQSQSTTCPTILVGVDYKEKKDWTETRERICLILDQWGLGAVGVLIRWDKNPLSCGGIRGQKPAGVEFCKTGARPGFSFAPHGSERGMGTFGGWLELWNHETNAWLPFGVTCAHCCFHPEDGRSAPSNTSKSRLYLTKSTTWDRTELTSFCRSAGMETQRS